MSAQKKGPPGAEEDKQPSPQLLKPTYAFFYIDF